MLVSIEQTAHLLNEGNIVAVPTDTVYGLAASLKHVTAIESVYLLKKRPLTHPINLLIHSLHEIVGLSSFLPPEFEKLADRFWPGPLTIVLPANLEKVPSILRGGHSTIGLRMPNQPQLLQLMAKTGPLATPSANLFGKRTSTSIEHIVEDFGKEFPIMEGKCKSSGVASTILIYQNGKWILSRQGSIHLNEIEQVIQKKIENITNF